jgi:hypothetical protein
MMKNESSPLNWTLWLQGSRRIEEKIESFGQLTVGWLFGDGVAPSNKTIKRATDFAQAAISLGNDIDAFPGAAGEIGIAVYGIGYSQEFIFEVDNTITYILDKDDESELIYTRDLSFDRALNYLTELKSFYPELEILTNLSSKIWLEPSSELSREKNITVMHSEGSAPWLFVIQPMVAASLYSMNNAPNLETRVPVSTSPNSITSKRRAPHALFGSPLKDSLLQLK